MWLDRSQFLACKSKKRAQNCLYPSLFSAVCSGAVVESPQPRSVATAMWCFTLVQSDVRFWFFSSVYIKKAKSHGHTVKHHSDIEETHSNVIEVRALNQCPFLNTGNILWCCCCCSFLESSYICMDTFILGQSYVQKNFILPSTHLTLQHYHSRTRTTEIFLGSRRKHYFHMTPIKTANAF